MSEVQANVRNVVAAIALIGALAPAVLVPAGEWLTVGRGGAGPIADVAGPDDSGVVRPRLSRADLERAIGEAKAAAGAEGGETTTFSPSASGRTAAGTPARDPFALPPAAAAAASRPPAVRLLGIFGGVSDGVATVSVNGEAVTLRVGEEVGGVRLVRVVPPLGAEVRVGGERVELRVE